MNIAIIGAGNVGGALGHGWAAAGHRIRFGVRKPSDAKIKAVLERCGPNAGASSPPEATSGAEVVVLTTPWEGTQDAIQSAGNLAGKILVDCTNPLALGANLLAGLTVGHTTSAAEEVARWAPGARVVKAFNTTGANNMANPRYGQARALMFVAGDDPEAKRTVVGLSNDLGFETLDAGPLRQARLLEPLAMLWISLAYAQGLGPDFAFSMLRR